MLSLAREEITSSEERAWYGPQDGKYAHKTGLNYTTCVARGPASALNGFDLCSSMSRCLVIWRVNE